MRPRCPGGTVPILVAIGVGLALGAGRARADEVTLAPGANVKGAVGGKVRGQVQSESASEVVVKLGVNTINVPADQVVAIHYDGQPPSMVLAETRASAGQLAEAADLYKKAISEASSKPIVQQAARFKQAEATANLALADPSKVGEAVGLLDAFTRAFPKSRQTGPALEILARLHLQKGDFARANQAIADLARLPRGADRASVLRARVLARQGEHAKALAELDRLIKASSEGTAMRREARLARAESLAGLKKFAEAESEARAVIRELPAEDIAGQSVAYNTLGDCLRAAGHPKDALFAYLHTDLLYNKDREQHPRALAEITRLWRQLRRDDRAEEVLKRLQQDYPQSSWVATARTPTGGATP